MSAPIQKLYRKNERFFSHIEGLRGMAAISIIVCHIVIYASFFLEKDLYYKMLDLTSVKIIAVCGIFLSVFFIISGLLIATVLMTEFKERGKVNILHFLMRRFSRIFPLYCLILILAMPFSMANVQHIWTNLLFINNLLPVKEQYLNWTWTIAVEFQFYLLFSAIIWLYAKKVIGKKICATLAIGFILLPAILVLAYIIQHNYYYISNQVFLANSQEFDLIVNIGLDKLFLHTAPLTYGIITAYILVYHKNKLEQWIDRLPTIAIDLITLSLITLLLLLFSNYDIWYLKRTHDLWQTSTAWIFIGYQQLFFPLFCTLLLLTCVSRGWVLKSIIALLNAIIWRPFARLSYGSYLLHPIFLLIGFSIYTSTHKAVSIAAYFKFGFFIILLTYLIAIPLYLLFEQPIMQQLIQFFSRRRQTSPLTEALQPEPPPGAPT